jgi:hypothetical protein
MKHFSGLDYFEVEDDQNIVGHEDNYYAIREYDYCDADMVVLAEYAGISRSSAYDAIGSLENNSLIERTRPLNNNPTWKVYVTPPKYFKREYLNEKIAKRYGIQDLPIK